MQLNDFLNELGRRRVHYSLSKIRPEAILVELTLPGERWEVEFMDDGRVEIERFKSDGQIHDGTALEELWELCRDEPA